VIRADTSLVDVDEGLVSTEEVAPVVLDDSLVAPIVLLLELRVGSVLVESGEVLAVELLGEVELLLVLG
jgi:hypothetical protein